MATRVATVDFRANLRANRRANHRLDTPETGASTRRQVAALFFVAATCYQACYFFRNLLALYQKPASKQQYFATPTLRAHGSHSRAYCWQNYPTPRTREPHSRIPNLAFENLGIPPHALREPSIRGSRATSSRTLRRYPPFYGLRKLPPLVRTAILWKQAFTRTHKNATGGAPVFDHSARERRFLERFCFGIPTAMALAKSRPILRTSSACATYRYPRRGDIRLFAPSG